LTLNRTSPLIPHPRRLTPPKNKFLSVISFSSVKISSWPECFLVSVSLLLGCYSGTATEQTIGLFLNLPQASPGYTLFTPVTSRNTYLIDNEGLLRHLWQADYVPGNAVYLRENGNLVRTADPGDLEVAQGRFNVGGDAGLIQEFDWDGNLIWEHFIIDATQRAHHDIALMPNGNVLAIVWEYKTSAEAIAAGRDPSTLPADQLWPDEIVELQPDGAGGATVVWEWRVWDHLIQDFDETKANFGVVADHPGLVDINFGKSDRHDWLHINAIDYNPQLDQIALSVPNFNEIWIIDHSTTSEAARNTGGDSGKGGNLLYRWGNPAAYRAAPTSDQQLFFQHAVNWIKPGLPGAGNLILFNNQLRTAEGEQFSAVDEIIPPVDSNGNYPLNPGSAYGPAAASWTYTADPPSSLFSSGMSSAQRLPNGNTLICEGRWGRFIEVTDAGDVVWLYVNPAAAGPTEQGQSTNGRASFKATRYPLDYPAFTNRDLTSLGPIEIDPDHTLQILNVQQTADQMVITNSSIPDFNYSLEYRETLDESDSWVEIGRTNALGTVTTFRDRDAARLNANQGFYRLKSLQPDP
jgi:hypothetical protein